MTQISQKINKPLKFILIVAISLLFVQIAADRALASEISSNEVIELVNKDRMNAGISALKENKILTEAAKEKAEDMTKNGYFAHTSPKGIEPWHWFDKAGYDYLYAGENLAINYKNAEDQEKAWMSSPTHRKNILNAKYEDIGVAMASAKIDGHDSLIVVQMFGKSTGANGSGKTVSASVNETDAISEVKSAQAYAEPQKSDQIFSLQPGKSVINTDSGRKLAGTTAVSLTMLAFFLAIVADVFVAYRKRQEEGIMA